MAYETQDNIDELKELLGLYSWRSENMNIQSDTYTELNSSGNLNMLNNDSLKKTIIAYYRMADQAENYVLEFNNKCIR